MDRDGIKLLEEIARKLGEQPYWYSGDFFEEIDRTYRYLTNEVFEYALDQSDDWRHELISFRYRLAKIYKRMAVLVFRFDSMLLLYRKVKRIQDPRLARGVYLLLYKIDIILDFLEDLDEIRQKKNWFFE